jgi:glucans biosynthesis protein C
MDDRRYFGLDALRGGMMMLGIVLHAAMYYLVTPPPTGPIPTDANNSVVFDYLFAFIHSFRMPTFFVLSGFFTALLVERRGVWGTYRNRAARILAPLAVGIVTLLPVTLVLVLDFMVAARYAIFNWIPQMGDLIALGSAMEALTIDTASHDEDLPLAHLWFLYYLCYFYLLIPVCRWLVARSLSIEAGIARMLASPCLVVPLGVGTAAMLWPYHGGQVGEGFMFVKPHLPSLVYYGSFFVLGYVGHHYRGALPALVRGVWRWAALAALLFPLSLHFSGLDNAVRGRDAMLHLWAVLANGFCTWALICFFVGAALRWFDRDSPWIQYVSQSSYWVFLVHMPLVTLAAFWLLRYDLPAMLKFLLACSFTAVIAFVTFHYWVQKSWVSTFLHGRRFDLQWPWRRTGESQLQLTGETPRG